MQREGYKGLTGLGRGKPCKEWTKTTKICEWALTESYGERKSKELFEKVFVWSETQFLKNFLYDFQLIETNRGSSKYLEPILIDRKTDSINRNKLRHPNFWEINTVFEKVLETSQSIEIEEQNVWVCDDIIFKNKNWSPIFPN